MSEQLWFQRESFNDSLRRELRWLLQDHWREVAHYQDIPLSPDWSHYENAHRARILYIFTARNVNWCLVGYAVFFVRPNPHYQTSWQAAQDILFIHPEYRGNGGRFIAWCDEQLRAESVQAVYHHVKAAHNWGKLLERMGYELVDLVYARRLDGSDSIDREQRRGDRLDGVRHRPEAQNAQGHQVGAGHAGGAEVGRDAPERAAQAPSGAERRLDGRNDSDGTEGNQSGGERLSGGSERPGTSGQQQEDAAGSLAAFAELMENRPDYYPHTWTE